MLNTQIQETENKIIVPSIALYVCWVLMLYKLLVSWVGLPWWNSVAVLLYQNMSVVSIVIFAESMKGNNSNYKDVLFIIPFTGSFCVVFFWTASSLAFQLHLSKLLSGIYAYLIISSTFYMMVLCGIIIPKAINGLMTSKTNTKRFTKINLIEATVF